MKILFRVFLTVFLYLITLSISAEVKLLKLIGDVWVCSGQSNMELQMGWVASTYKFAKDNNGKFVWANAVIGNNHIIVWSNEVKNPVAVRYAWADNPENANLYNKEGLPASPFRTDE